MSITTATPTPSLSRAEAGTVTRAGWWLVASFASFLLGFVIMIVQGIITGTIVAEDEAADRLGLAVNELPSDVVAEIYGYPGWFHDIHVVVPLLAAPLLLLPGIVIAARVAAPRQRTLARAAIALAAGCAVTWLVVMVLSELLMVEQLPVRGWMAAFVAATAGLGAAALGALVLVLRGRGIARRTGAVVAVLAGLVVVGCMFVPPVAPFVLALILGISLVRTRPSVTM